MRAIVMLGCFDTKAEDFGYLYQCLVEYGADVVAINLGIKGSTNLFPVTVEAEDVIAKAGVAMEELREANDRNSALGRMGAAAAALLDEYYQEGKIDGVMGMGGGGGTFLTLRAIQSLPFGIPKICISTVATKDLSRQAGTKAVVLFPSLVDIAGLNRISRVIIRQAAGAMVGMINATRIEESSKKTIAISMFGNTTSCVEMCSKMLRAKGFEVLIFHSVGSGGLTMESLIREGAVDGVLDITTTELADELCQGICSAGPDRLSAAAEAGIPQVVVPGCIDMVNFGHMNTVPEKYQHRLLFSWAPDVTLMRTDEEENRLLGKEIAHKLNGSSGPVKVLLPIEGLSEVSRKGEVFYAPQADQVLFDTIKREADSDIEVIDIQANINDKLFAEQAVNHLLKMIK